MKLECATFLDRYRDSAPGTAVLLDVRNPDEVALGSLAEAIHIPLPELETRLGEIPRTKAVFIYCRSGGRAGRAADLLRAAGFPNVVVADGGGYEQLATL